MREHKYKPNTQATKIYSLMSLKSNNHNKIRYKQINKNLTINNGWRYLAIHDCCTKETIKIFES